MSSPRKYTSPYLTGLPGLGSSSTTSSTIKPKKKSSRSSVTKLSESAAAVKRIQDGIWQSAKDSARNLNEQASPRQEISLDDASSCGGIVVEKFLDEMNETAAPSESQTPVGSEGQNEKKAQEDDSAEENMGQTGASALVVSKDSILLTRGSGMESCSAKEGTQESSSQQGEETTAQEHPSPIPVPSALLKSILKKPSIYAIKSKKESVPNSGRSKRSSKGTPKAKYGRPVRDAPSVVGRVVVTKLKGAQGSTSNLEVHNKFSNNKTLVKSPRKKSTVVVDGKCGEEQEKDQQQVERKSVRFATRVDVHAVPYEPRAGSRACDWQRNMLEQRVQTFRQLMKDVGGTEEMDLFGNAVIFPGYSTYHHVPNPNFALRGHHHNAGPPVGGGLVGIPGIGRPRNNLCNSNSKYNY